MARRTAADCIKGIQKAAGDKLITEGRARELLDRIDRLAKQRAARTGSSLEKSLKDIAGEIIASEKTAAAINERNRLLTIKAKRRINAFIDQFDTVGEGLLAFIQGSSKDKPGSRLSVDYSAKAKFHKYLGEVSNELEDAGVLEQFNSNSLDREIYIELGELGRSDAKPGRSGSKDAATIASILHRHNEALVAEQNLNGSFIRKEPGYITQQTHDRSRIRAAGGHGITPEEKFRSYQEWSNFVKPLLDNERTFQGTEPDLFLRNVHNNLYVGVFGNAGDEVDVDAFTVHGSLAKRTSSSRVLHFKDAESAYEYNQRFGTRRFKDAYLSNLRYRTRAIALMENFGPNPNRTFDGLIGELKKRVREQPDSARQVASLDDWRLQAAFKTVTGELEIPENISLARISNNLRILRQLASLGGVVITSLGDKAFTHLELASQGLGNMKIMAESFGRMFNRSKDQKQYARLLGVAMDGITGNAVARYDFENTTTGALSAAQEKFFHLNFMSWWNDVNKSAAVETMSAHIASLKDSPLDTLPGEIQQMFRSYDITAEDWNLIRGKAIQQVEGQDFIFPDAIRNIDLIDPSTKNKDNAQALIKRRLNALENKIRVMFADRADIAVPTPGAREKKFANLGTRAGTPLGEVVRMLTMFKQFPTTIITKVLGQHIYKNSNTVAEFLRSDHLGKFRIAGLVAATTVAGYFSGAIKDIIAGRTPKDPRKPKSLLDAMQRGGALGIYGDFLMTEYDQSYRGFIGLLGPMADSALDAASIVSQAVRGEDIGPESYRFARDNTPFINLFYIRPVLNYFILNQLQEMMSPGSRDRTEKFLEEEFGQQLIGN